MGTHLSVQIGSNLQTFTTMPFSMSDWKRLVLVLQPTNNTEAESEGSGLVLDTLDILSNISVTIYHDEMQLSSYMLETDFPDTITSIDVGGGFTGLIQDLGIFPFLLDDSGGSVMVPQEADFLPQCLCPMEYQLSTSEEACDNNGVTVMR